MIEHAYISRLIDKAAAALKDYEAYTQEQVDACVKAMCLAFQRHAQVLAEEAVEETGYGSVEVKTAKNEQAADAIWYALKDEKSVGIIGEDAEKKLIYVAKPVGVIAAITPSTNPSTTILFNACYALKGRNVVIFSTHPGAKKTSFHTIEILKEALQSAGAPQNLLQYVDAGELNLSDELMSRCNLSLVAGSAKAVHKGYCSGHPCIGVSHGNVQTIVDRGYDYRKAVRESVYSCGFDNGLICACTQAVLAPEESREQFLQLFREHGAHIITEEAELEKLRYLLFPDSENFDRNYVGKSAAYIAEHAGIRLMDGASILLAAPARFEDDDPLLKGEMSPVCLLLTYGTFEEAVSLAARGLSKDGAGHSTVIYTSDVEKAKYMALALPITRLLVNQPGIYAANQQIRNGLAPTSNLSCGSWANNSFSENITYKHMLNICRIAWELDEDSLPSREEIWA